MSTETHKEKQIATINGTAIAVPETIKAIVNAHGNLLTAKEYLQRANGLPVDRKAKLTDIVKSLGDKAKVQIKAYNTAKPLFYRLSAQVWALCAADATMKKSHRLVLNRKGEAIGFNGSARWGKSSAEANALAEENASLRARLAMLEAPAKA